MKTKAFTYPDRQSRAVEKAQRRDNAAGDFPRCRRLAEGHGLILERISDVHYQLSPSDGSWLLNIYPGNCRLYHDRNMQPSPFIRIEKPWTLREVVEAMVAELAKRRERLMRP